MHAPILALRLKAIFSRTVPHSLIKAIVKSRIQYTIRLFISFNCHIQAFFQLPFSCFILSGTTRQSFKILLSKHAQIFVIRHFPGAGIIPLFNTSDALGIRQLQCGDSGKRSLGVKAGSNNLVHRIADFTSTGKTQQHDRHYNRRKRKSKHDHSFLTARFFKLDSTLTRRFCGVKFHLVRVSVTRDMSGPCTR